MVDGSMNASGSALQQAARVVLGATDLNLG
jgi:hypothetical protein